MAGFNMMDLMNNESKSQTSKPSYELREIPIGKLIPNPANAYSMTGIEELANSILLAGRVLQNLVVKPADENGNYMIISGHRRHLASKMLVEQGHNEFANVSALVENERNETLQELMLIYTNSTARELTDAEKMRQATRATELLKSLKEKGQFSERIRDAVAKMLNTTSGQIGRYQAIANNLKNEDLKEKFESGEMGVSAAYEASRLSEEGQKKIAEQMKEGKTVSVHDIKQENPSAGGGEKDTSASDEDNPIRIVGEPEREKEQEKALPTGNAEETSQASPQSEVEPFKNANDEAKQEPEEEEIDEEELRDYWIRKKAIMEVVQNLEGQIDLKVKEAEIWAEDNNAFKERIAREAADFIAELVEAANESVAELDQMLDGADTEFENKLSCDPTKE